MKVEYTLVDLRDIGSNQTLYTECLKLRREVFISSLGWNLTESEGCEFDQYDTPASIHFAAVADERVIGCIRLMRTDHVQGDLTYMILDAHRGKIKNLPSGLLEMEIRSSKVWEASRMAISQLLEKRQRNVVLAGLVNASKDYVAARSGDAIIGMMNPIFRIVFKRAKIDAQIIGPTLNQRDGPICILKMEVRKAPASETLIRQRASSPNMLAV